MRSALLLLSLALVHENRARLVKSYEPNVEGLTLEEQLKINQYEQDILQMRLQKQKASSSQIPREQTNEITSLSNYETSQVLTDNTTLGLQKYKTTGKFLISVQDMLTSDKNATEETKDPENIFEDALAITRNMNAKHKQSIREVYAENKEIGKNWKNATQLIKENDYAVEEHNVKTQDGYYITLFRVQSKLNSQEVTKRPVALLVHGLLGSADDWLLMGPKKSLAYQMTDADFDVWLGNVRGSKYSQYHSSKYCALPDFWEFSIDEIAAHDLPAMIDYILKVTRDSKLHYIGYSLGATVFFAMAADNPEHSQKVVTMHALSPMVYMDNVRSPLLRTISPKSRYYDTVQQLLGYGEFNPNKDFMRIIGGQMYENIIGTTEVSSNLKYVVFGVNSVGMDRKMIPIIIKQLPAGASVKQIKHYGQAKAAGQLRKYDYGVELNRMTYGQPVPPSYNMTNVHVPVAIYFSEQDLLAHPKDVERLLIELPMVKDFYKVPEQDFSHMDFQFSERAPVIINKRLINSIRQMK